MGTIRGAACVVVGLAEESWTRAEEKEMETKERLLINLPRQEPRSFSNPPVKLVEVTRRQHGTSS